MPGPATKWKWSSVLMIIPSICEAEVEIEAIQVKLVYLLCVLHFHQARLRRDQSSLNYN